MSVYAICKRMEIRTIQWLRLVRRRPFRAGVRDHHHTKPRRGRPVSARVCIRHRERSTRQPQKSCHTRAHSRSQKNTLRRSHFHTYHIICCCCRRASAHAQFSARPAILVSASAQRACVLCCAPEEPTTRSASCESPLCGVLHVCLQRVYMLCSVHHTTVRVPQLQTTGTPRFCARGNSFIHSVDIWVR